MLVPLVHSCIQPDSRSTQISKKMVLYYAITEGHKIELGELLFKGILKCWCANQNGGTGKKGLYFGSLITRMMLHKNVPCYENEATQACQERPYDLGSWKKSIGSKKFYVGNPDDNQDAFIIYKMDFLLNSNTQVGGLLMLVVLRRLHIIQMRTT